MNLPLWRRVNPDWFSDIGRLIDCDRILHHGYATGLRGDLAEGRLETEANQNDRGNAHCGPPRSKFSVFYRHELVFAQQLISDSSRRLMWLFFRDDLIVKINSHQNSHQTKMATSRRVTIF